MPKSLSTDGRRGTASGVWSMASTARCWSARACPAESWTRCAGCTRASAASPTRSKTTSTRELIDDDEIKFERGALRVVHTPGHTPGSCSFLREADRTIIAGDCVLKRITPNPVLSPDPIDPTRRFRSLAEYLVSLARLRSLHADARLRRPRRPRRQTTKNSSTATSARYDERQAEVIRLIPKTGATAWDVAQRTLPRLRRRPPLPRRLRDGRTPRLRPHRRQARRRTHTGSRSLSPSLTRERLSCRRRPVPGRCWCGARP